MKFAIISDIHSNKEALEAVLEDIDSKGIQDIFCLGDIVGYGPDPIEVIDMVRNNSKIKVCVSGNHDEYVSGNESLFWKMNVDAKRSLSWTKEQLSPKYTLFNFVSSLFDKTKDLRKECLKFISNTKHSFTINDTYLLSHGSIVSSDSHEISDTVRFAYIQKKEDVEYFADILLDRPERIAFVGHSHIPFFSKINGHIEFFKARDDAMFGLEKSSSKYIINVGSVGQPRDNDTRSCYVIVDDDVLRFRRIAYDVDKTYSKLMKIKGEDFSRLARRLKGEE